MEKNKRKENDDGEVTEEFKKRVAKLIEENKEVLDALAKV